MRLHTGNTTNKTIAATPIAIHNRCDGKRARRAAPAVRFRGTNAAGISRFNRTALQREQSLRPLLNEDDDEDEHGDFRQYRALPCLQELVDNAKTERRVDSARQLSDAAQHDHHERIDDIALTEVRTHVADLRQRASGETGDARAESKRKHVDAYGRDAERASHAAVLRDGAHKQAETRA